MWIVVQIDIRTKSMVPCSMLGGLLRPISRDDDEVFLFTSKDTADETVFMQKLKLTGSPYSYKIMKVYCPPND